MTSGRAPRFDTFGIISSKTLGNFGARPVKGLDGTGIRLRVPSMLSDSGKGPGSDGRRKLSTFSAHGKTIYRQSTGWNLASAAEC